MNFQLNSPADDTAIADRPRVKNRQPESDDGLQLPQDLIVVSADDHLAVTEDIFYQRFPAKLKDRAPRIWQEGAVNHLGFDGQTLSHSEALLKTLGENEEVPGCYDIEERYQQMRLEGVDKSINFPQLVILLARYPDIMVRETAYRIYNEHLAELQERKPGFFYGVGFVDQRDPTNARARIAELKALGLKTFMLPMAAGKYPDGTDAAYSDEAMTPFWEAVEEADITVCFHIGENIQSQARGGTGTFLLQSFMPFRKIVGELVFGGVFDRHPSLRIMFAEAGINWLLSTLQDVKMIAASYNRIIDWKLQHPPAHYWRNNFYATFIDDPLGLSLIDQIGAGRALWSLDYPHVESTFGWSRTLMKSIVEQAGEKNGRRILGGNAIDIFKLHD